MLGCAVSACAAAEAPPALAPVASGPPIDPGPGIVCVHLESPEEGLALRGFGAAKLQAEPDGRFLSFGPVEPLCQAPCDAYVDVRDERPLVVEAPTAPASAPFLLSDLQGPVRITVEPGDDTLFVAGLTTTMVGGTGALVGGGLMLVGMVTRSGELTSRPQDLMLGGGIALGVGAALVAAGLVMRYVGTTFVDIEPGPSGTAATSAEPLTIRW
jgi:hypothetical protein